MRVPRRSTADNQTIPGASHRRPEPTPAQRALALLVRREHSRQELTRKLAARGVEATEAAAAVERMAREGWQDDSRFALALARSRAINGYGPLRIRAELAMHGIPEDAIARAFQALAESGEDDWQARAAGLVERRFGGFPGGLAARRRVADLLARRGFDADTVRHCARLAGDGG
ncbi:MAG: recombination regulator RecX [Pseudomonadota bacterium]|nr:recombination regulator RecX [Pseudomonadota bacterium]